MTHLTPWPRTVGNLVLRHPSRADLDVAFAFRNTPEVNAYMVLNRVTREAFERDFDLASPTAFSCVAVRDDQVVGIGFIDLTTPEGDPDAPQLSQAIIGYIVAPQFWGQGVGRAIAAGVVAACRETLGARRIYAYCHKANTASARVLEGAGLRLEGHTIAAYYSGELGWQDGLAYAVLTDDNEEAERAPMPTFSTKPGVIASGAEPSPGDVRLVPHVAAEPISDAKGGASQLFDVLFHERRVAIAAVVTTPGIGHHDTPADAKNAILSVTPIGQWAMQDVANSAVTELACMALADPDVRRLTFNIPAADTATRQAASAAGFRLSRCGFRDTWRSGAGWQDSTTYEALRDQS